MDNTQSNSYLTQFNPEKKAFGFYLLGSLVIILFSFFGQIPMFFFLPEQLPVSENQMDLFAHLDSNLTLFLFLFPSVVAFFGFCFVVKVMHRQSLTAVTTRRNKIDLQRILFGFLFWGIISLLIFGLDLIISPEDYSWNFKPVPFLIMFLIACCFIPFQSALEEWIFRGYLMQGFAGLTKSRFLSLALTSIIFNSFFPLIRSFCINETLYLWKSNTFLFHIFAFPFCIRNLRFFVPSHKNKLSNTFVGINLSWKWCSIRKF